MSEPRKIYTGGAVGSEQDQYEAARRQAQQLAAQSGRRRIQQPVRTVQGRQISQRPQRPQPAPEAEPEAPRPIEQPAPQPAETPVQPVQPEPQEPAEPRPLTRAQQQAMALRAAAERKYGDTVRFPAQSARPAQAASAPAAAAPAAEAQRTIRRASAAEQPAAHRTVNRAPARQAAARPAARRPAAPAPTEAPVRPAPQKAKPAVFDYDAVVGTDPEANKKAKGGIRMDASAKRRTYHADGGSANPPARGKGSGKKGKGGKKKKKTAWWKILLIVLLVIALIFGGAAALILNGLKPAGTNGTTISSIVNTPKEYQGKEFNLLVVGIDRSSEGNSSSDGVNDGMTDMILWMHFDNVNKTVSMLQIPRNIMVTTDTSVSGNYQINAVAKTQGSDGYNNIDALAQLLYDQFKLEVDGYISVRLEALSELIDILGGIDVNVPETIDYRGVEGGGDSYLEAGYQRLNGAQAEFFLRARKTYGTSDLKRLEVQRYFYAALFARLRSMTVIDIARMLPFMLTYVETDLGASDLVSVAVSMLSIHSDQICFGRVPVYMGNLNWPQNVEKPNSVLVVAPQETADLLNTYFRSADRQVDVSELNFCEVLNTSGMVPQDAAITVMNDLNKNVVDAQQNNNLIPDDVAQTDQYEVVSDSTSDTTAEGEGDSTSEPAA